MGFRINTNVITLKAQRNLEKSTGSMNRALERLASGSRINKAGDDAAGLAVSEGLRSQVRGLQQAIRNANDGVGFLQTAEGALAEATNIVQRIRELGIQAANGAIADNDRINLNNEVSALLEEFQRIASSTEYNGVYLLDGTFVTKDLQVGTRKGQTISFSIGDARATSIGSLATQSGAQNSLTGTTSNLIINGISFTAASSTDDTLSTSGNAFSALAVAKRINGKVSETKVEADIQNAIVRTVTAPAFSAWTAAGGAGTLAGDTFKINGVEVVGTGISSTNAFIEAVNRVSSLSGVKARLQSGSTTQIEFFTLDGRNVQIQVSGFSAGTVVSSSFAYALFGGSGNTAVATTYSGGGFGYTAALTAITAGVSMGDINAVLTGAIRLRSASEITIAQSTSASAMLGIANLSAGNTVIGIDTTQNLATVSIDSQARASDALIVVDAVITQLVNIRARLGAVQNRLESNTNNLSITAENLAAAQSQIRDADLAIETAELTKNQILQQAGVAVMGQANVSAQAALQLLKF